MQILELLSKKVQNHSHVLIYYFPLYDAHHGNKKGEDCLCKFDVLGNNITMILVIYSQFTQLCSNNLQKRDYQLVGNHADQYCVAGG